MNRLLLSAFALSCALGVARAEDDPKARELFDAMTQRLTSAKTVKLAFRANVGPQGQEIKLAGDLYLAEGNLVALVTQGKKPDESPLRTAVVSDGTTLFRWRQDGRDQVGKGETPANLGARFRACLCKLTSLGSAFVFSLPAEGGDDPFQATNFVLGEEQEVKGRKIRVVQYDAALASGPLGRVQVAIDTETGLPVQRRVFGGEQGMSIVEVYTAIELNGELPKETFEIPELRQAPQPKPEDAQRAQTLLHQLDAKFRDAKTARVVSTTYMGPPKQRVKLTTRLELGEGGKLNLELEGVAKETPVRMRVVSDGSKRLTIQAAGEREQRDAGPSGPALGALARAAVARLSQTVLLRTDALDDPTIPVANLRLGALEKEGERELQLIEFDSVAPDLPMHVRVWIDVASGLPVRRVIGDATHAEAMVEVFESIELNVPVDESKFALPQ